MAADRTSSGPQGRSAALLSVNHGDKRARTRPHFAIGTHHFVAIPHQEWSVIQRGSKGSERLRAAGFVRLDGVRHVVVEHREFDGASERSSPISSLLTSRELQIAYSVAEGKCDKVIAYELGISEYTVREHLRRIFHKLKVSKRAALVAQLIKTRFGYPSGANE
jgi:DNA-binding CsgD family transcriptional regulator